jgi:hypothetical protein
MLGAGRERHGKAGNLGGETLNDFRPSACSDSTRRNFIFASVQSLLWCAGYGFGIHKNERGGK